MRQVLGFCYPNGDGNDRVASATAAAVLRAALVALTLPGDNRSGRGPVTFASRRHAPFALASALTTNLTSPPFAHLSHDSMAYADSGRTGVVVIGRNEGERLRRCLESLRNAGSIVYVDSGSTDGSAELARSVGVEVVDLDMQIPFTAARARNAGFARLRQIAPVVAFVQFVDGDCELIEGWLAAAASFLLQHPDVACVCGRLRERFPQRSVYNRLCDVEWDRDAGETAACGGIAMMRATVLRFGRRLS